MAKAQAKQKQAAKSKATKLKVVVPPLKKSKPAKPKAVKAVIVTPPPAWPYPTAAAVAAAVNKDVSTAPAVLDALIPGKKAPTKPVAVPKQDARPEMEIEEWKFFELALLTVFHVPDDLNTAYLKVGNSTAIKNVEVDFAGHILRTTNAPTANGDREVPNLEKVRFKKNTDVGVFVPE